MVKDIVSGGEKSLSIAVIASTNFADYMQSRAITAMVAKLVGVAIFHSIGHAKNRVKKDALLLAHPDFAKPAILRPAASFSA